MKSPRNIRLEFVFGVTFTHTTYIPCGTMIYYKCCDDQFLLLPRIAVPPPPVRDPLVVFRSCKAEPAVEDLDASDEDIEDDKESLSPSSCGIQYVSLGSSYSLLKLFRVLLDP